MSNPKIQQGFSEALEISGLVFGDLLFKFIAHMISMAGSLQDYLCGEFSLEDAYAYGWNEQTILDVPFRKSIERAGRAARESCRALLTSPFSEYYYRLACGRPYDEDLYLNE